MKVFKLFNLACLFFLSHSALQADQFLNFDAQLSTNHRCHHHSQDSHFGSAGYGTTDSSLWYTVSTNSYPEAVPLSLERNKGVTEGNIYHSPTGFTVGETGDYFVTMTVILQNPGIDSILIQAFLAQNEIFDSVDPQIGGIVALEPNAINSLHGSGIIKDIEAGTRISLVSTNAGNPFPQDVTVVGWGINLVKLR